MSNRTFAVESASFTRPANTTAYASGDLVANDTTAGSVVPLTLPVARAKNIRGSIKRVRVKKSGTSTTNAAFRVHFFNVLPVVANGDNGVFAPVALRSYGYMGYADVTVGVAGGTSGAAGVGAPAVGADIVFEPVAGTRNIYALVEARGAYTPESGETIEVEVEVNRD